MKWVFFVRQYVWIVWNNNEVDTLSYYIDIHSNLVDLLTCFLDIYSSFLDKDSNMVDIDSSVLDIHSSSVDIDSSEIDSHNSALRIEKWRFVADFITKGTEVGTKYTKNFLIEMKENGVATRTQMLEVGQRILTKLGCFAVPRYDELM